jgi:transcriptional regulator with XRE-family HTH domain
MKAPSPIKTQIRAVRKARGMTLAQVAGHLGTTPQSVQRVETGNMTCSLEWLYAIADVFGIQPHLLLIPLDSLPAEERAIEMMRAALVRCRRDLPKLNLANLIEAQGALATALLDCEGGLRSPDDVAKAAVAVAAITMRMGIDGGKMQTNAGPKLVEDAA